MVYSAEKLSGLRQKPRFSRKRPVAVASADMRVALYIEGNPHWQDKISGILKGVGYDIAIAESLYRAESYANSQKYDVCIIGEDVPLSSDKDDRTTSSLEVYECIKSAKRGAYWFAVISNENDMAEEFAQEGIEFFTRTPFDEKTFRSFMERL